MIERYTRKEMGEIWSDLNKFRLWLNVELSYMAEKLKLYPPLFRSITMWKNLLFVSM